MKALSGSIAGLVAVVLSVVSVRAVDIWQLSALRAHGRTSRVRRWMFGEHLTR